jgi:lysophospholipase L1-like esterase
LFKNDIILRDKDKNKIKKLKMHTNLKWQTRVELPSYPFQISYSDKILSVGSCFAEHMSRKLERLKYQILANPFGIQYNPASIGRGLKRLLDHQNFHAEELVQHQGLWHSWMHHGSYSNIDKEASLTAIQSSFEQAHQQLIQTDYLLITLGTSWIYRLKESQEIVNNCHKFPTHYFQRDLLSVDQIVRLLAEPIARLQELRPELKVLTTVSPVRHLKDGAIENQRSKARLSLALEELEQQLDAVYYFPAYEIMMDQLRDYRFYQRDLTHPSELAQDFIWEQLEKACLNQGEADLRKRVEKFVQAISHRPLHPDQPAHQAFLQKLLRQLDSLQAELPKAVNWQHESRQIENQIKAID